MEIFKQIEGYKNYKVSTFGNVYRNDKKLMPVLKNGYHSISLSRDGKVKKCYIHRLVAFAFIENTNNKKQINHKNGIRTDNNIDNLEWNTPKENIIHSFKVLKRKSASLKGESNGMYKYRGANNPNSKRVQCLNDSKIYGSRKEAARYYGINAGNITLICNGKRKTIKGNSFKWID
jgi:hypothetical protein